MEPEILTIQMPHQRASRDKRFINYIIDLVSFYAFSLLVGLLSGIFFPSYFENLPEDDPDFGLMERLISLALYAIYMSMIEGIFKGKTLGKLVTGTRAVNLDDTRINMSTAFARGFSRAVPFCIFSAFGDPCNSWQDRWTDAKVIDEKTS